MADTLRGDGLARAQRTLAGLERDPQRLDRARIRFDDSPPPYTSDRSGTTTRSQSPDPPSEEQRRHQERRIQLGLEADASRPDKQFSHQINEEEERVFEASLNGIRRVPVGSDPRTIAREKVKKLWVEQGIWNNKWDEFAYGRWKHEEPLELESESETGSEAGLSPPIFSFPKSPSQNRGSRRATTKSDGLQSGESYGSVSVRFHVHIISSSTRYRRSVKESKKNPRMGKALMLQTSIRGRTRMSRTPGPSEEFGMRYTAYVFLAP